MSSDSRSPLDPFQRIHDFITATEQGPVSEGEQAEFEKFLRGSGEARKLYAEYLEQTLQLARLLAAPDADSDAGRDSDLDTSLRGKALPGASSSALPGRAHGKLHSARRSPLIAVAVCLAVAVSIVAVVVKFSFPGSRPPIDRPDVARSSQGALTPAPQQQNLASASEDTDKSAVAATITGMMDCRWAASEPSSQLRECVKVGRQFTLESGLLELTYDTGAKVILHGPVSYKIATNNSGFLAYGDLTGIVEKPVSNGRQAMEERDMFGCRPLIADPPLFTVRTPSADVADLGTEFGVRVAHGRTDSRVFRGKVKVGVSTDNRQPSNPGREIIVKANESLRVEKQQGEVPMVILRTDAAEPRDFAREDQMAAPITEPRNNRRSNDPPSSVSSEFRHWQEFSRELQRRDDLVAYYDFQLDPSDASVLRNRASTGNSFDGRIDDGAAWVDGRFPGKSALKFIPSGHGVRINLPEKLQQVTLLAWVQIDRLGPLNALLHSDGWEEAGQTAWQINHLGQLSIGIHNSVNDLKHRAREQDMAWRKLGVPRETLACWCQLATVYDSQRQRAQFYVNGQQIADLPIATRQPILLGPAAIGSHNADASDANPGDRTLQGRMDELMIFNTALATDEIRRIYNAARTDFSSKEDLK